MRTAVRRDTGAGAEMRSLAVAGFLATAVVLVLPRWTVGLLPFLALVWWLAARLRGESWRADIVGGALPWVLLLFLVYLAVNASWALDPSSAYGRVALLVLFLVMVYACLHQAEEASQREVGVLSAALAAGALVGVALLAAEVASGRALSKVVFDLAPALRPAEPRQMTLLDELNRNVGLLMLLFWPLVLIMRRLKDARARFVATPLFVTGVAVAVLLSEHHSSRVALIAGALAFLAVQRRPRAARRAILTLWCAAFILVVPASIFAYQAGLHTVPWLPDSAQARVILWSHTASRVAQAPILGIGVRSTFVHDVLYRPGALKPPGHVFPLHTGRHAHNIYLQSWFELGAFGAALLLAIGVLVLRRFKRLAAPVQPYVYAQFVTIMAVGAFSWGMWQPWYQAGIALAAGVMGLAVARARHTA